MIKTNLYNCVINWYRRTDGQTDRNRCNLGKADKWFGITEQSHSILSSLTLLQYFSKILVVARAVPSAVPKLVLALPHAQPGPFSHLSDDLRLSLAELGLFPGQALCLPANGVGVHHQRTAHRPGKDEIGRQRRARGISIRGITGESPLFLARRVTPVPFTTM